MTFQVHVSVGIFQEVHWTYTGKVSSITDVYQSSKYTLLLLKKKIKQKLSSLNIQPLLETKNQNYALMSRKTESQNRCFKKTKPVKFSVKRIFLNPWYAHVHVRIWEWEMFVFRKIWRALFSWNTRFEIRHFVLLLANCNVFSYCKSIKVILKFHSLFYNGTETCT